MASHTIRLPRWKAPLCFVVCGGVAGYFSFENLNVWGGGNSQYGAIWISSFFAGTVLFLTGFARLSTIAFQLISSPAAAHIPNIESKRSIDTRSLWAFQIFRFTVSALVVLAGLVLWSWGGPKVGSIYGRSYWTCALTTLLVSQFPYLVSLFRTWCAPERIGLSVGVVAAFGQLLAEFLPILRYPGTPPDPWPWFSIAACLSACVFGVIALRAVPSRRENFGSVISIVFGFAAYMIIAEIAIVFLCSRLRA